jgi:hypothetical protein
VLKKLCLKKLVFVVLFFLFSILVAASSTIAKTNRGEEPQCQDECLATHSTRMKLLSEECSKTGDKMKYQGAVEDEASRYFQCLTNCRALLPVK